jgi:hypothetical protein
VYEHTTKNLVGKRKKIKYTLPSIQGCHSAKNSLPSVIRATLGKVFLKLLKQSLLSACKWALGKAIFAECPRSGTWQSIFLN